MRTNSRRTTFNEMARDLNPKLLYWKAKYLRECGYSFTTISKEMKLPLKLIEKWVSKIKFRQPTKKWGFSSDWYFSVKCGSGRHDIPSWCIQEGKQRENIYGTLLDPDFRQGIIGRVNQFKAQQFYDLQRKENSNDQVL